MLGKLIVYFHAFILCLIGISSSLFAQNAHYNISSNQLEQDGAIHIYNWKARAGDNFNWLDDTLSFTSWTDIDTRIISDHTLDNWNGIGWFKIIIEVDESLVYAPIPILFSKNYGALELYLNGKFIDRVGEVSVNEENSSSLLDHHAVMLQIPDTLTHVLTVRFANHKSSSYEKTGLENGFQLTLFNYNTYLQTEEVHEKEHTHLITVIAFLTSLSIIHLLLLIFYPSGQKNFYFTFIAASIAIFTLFENGAVLFNDPELLILAVYLKEIAWLFAYLCILKFSYSFTKKSSPKQLLVILIIALLITAISFLTTWPVEVARSILSVVILLEFARIVFIQKSLKQPVDLLLIGLGVFLVMIFLDRDIFKAEFHTGFPFLKSMNAITVLVASLSFYLLRDFAKAQTKLEYKYLEVKHLSERSIDQERKNKEKEFKQKLLEAENERKTAELEEARTLQLSMLPTEIPKSKYWKMAVRMETAHEVGGDYYDFYESSEHEFIAAVGDATGHGMKAGIIVATVKSNFLSTIGSSSLIDTLQRISTGIRNLDLRMLYMGLMLFRVNKHNLTFTSAGMPQALWFRASNQTVEELLIKAMPLGTTVNFTYTEHTVDAQKGDVLLIVSDGLIELFNRNREQLGIDEVKKFLIENAGKKPEQILHSLFALKENWSNGAAQEDDVTILVMKAI